MARPPIVGIVGDVRDSLAGTRSRPTVIYRSPKGEPSLHGDLMGSSNGGDLNLLSSAIAKPSYRRVAGSCDPQSMDAVWQNQPQARIPDGGHGDLRRQALLLAAIALPMAYAVRQRRHEIGADRPWRQSKHRQTWCWARGWAPRSGVVIGVVSAYVLTRVVTIAFGITARSGRARLRHSDRGGGVRRGLDRGPPGGSRNVGNALAPSKEPSSPELDAV